MESHDIWIYGLIPASFITVFGLKKIQHKEHIEKKIKVTAICLFLTLSLIDSYMHFLAGLSLSYFATSIILNLFVITIFMIPALIVSRLLSKEKNIIKSYWAGLIGGTILLLIETVIRLFET